MRSDHRAPFRLAALLVAAALAAAACGGDDDAGAPTPTEAPAPTVADTEPTATEPTVAATPTTGPAATTNAETPAPTLPDGIATPESLSIAISGGIQATHVATFAALEGPLAAVAEHYGVRLDTFLAASGADAIAAISGGSAQICVCGTNRALAAIASGEDMAAIFNPFVGNGTVLVGAKEHESEIGSDIAGYADKVWAYASEGGTNAIAAQSVVEANGLAWDSINRVTYGDVAAGIPTLQSGRADLMAFDPVSAANAVALDIGYVIANLLDPENPLLDTSAIIATSVWARGDFADQYPEFLQAVVTALVESLQAVQANSGSSAEVLAMLPADFQEAFTEPGIWDAQWAIVEPAVNGTDGLYSEANIEAALADAVVAGAIPAPDDSLRAHFHNEYVEQAIATLG